MTVQSIAFGRVDRSRLRQGFWQWLPLCCWPFRWPHLPGTNGDDAVLQWNDATRRCDSHGRTAGAFTVTAAGHRPCCHLRRSDRIRSGARPP